jgi:hypothetical protein
MPDLKLECANTHHTIFFQPGQVADADLRT